MTDERALPALVAVVNNEADWQHIWNDHWYRIPVKRAPAQLAASFLAFYQTKWFGTKAWAIHYYAPIVRYRQMTRREILPDASEHPRAADLYVVIDLGTLLALPRPIPSRRLRRITFIPTTLGRLLDAREVNDLWLHAANEDVLWAWFRDAGLKAEQRLEIDGPVQP